MMKLKREELSKLPYFQLNMVDDRLIALFPFWHEGAFHMPIPDPQRAEIVSILKPLVLAEGSYIAKEPVNPQLDIRIPLLELIMQRYSFERAVNIVRTVESDVLNFSAILEKYELILADYRTGAKEFRDQSFLIETELELLFNNVRSLYDQLQSLIRLIWHDTTLFDTLVKKQELPKSFRDVILYGKDDKAYSEEEMTTRYGLPSSFAAFYHTQINLFKLCRAIRNRVVHRGQPISRSPIFTLQDGFAVDTTEYPFSEFHCWSSDSLRQGKLGSVRALIAYIAEQTIQATTAYADTLESCIQLPPPIAPEWHVYTRGSFVPHLQNLSVYMNQPWSSAAAANIAFSQSAEGNR